MALINRRAGRAQVSGGALAPLLERAHVTVAGLVLLGFAVPGWFLARYIGSRPLFLLVYAAVVIMAGAWFASRRTLAIDVTRSSLPGRVREGQTIAVELNITGQKRASTLILEEKLDPALGQTTRLPLASIGAGEELTHSYTFTPVRRGIYQLGPTSATWSDPFGLTTQDQVLAEPINLIVHPRTELVHDRVLTRMWEDPPVRPPVSKPWPTGFEFYGMREYVPGDDLRRVVWTAVAKTGKMLVRESEQGISDRVSIYLDNSKEWHSPGDPSETFETGIRVAASLCAKHVADGFSVNLHAADAELSLNQRGPRARFNLLDELAKLQMTKRTMADAGGRILGESRRGAHFVVITPHLDRATADQIRLVLERGASVVLVKLTWEESDPLSWSRAAELGCQVVRVGTDGSIEAAFTHQVQGTRR